MILKHYAPGQTPSAELVALMHGVFFSNGIEGDVVEIGSWCGDSACVMASVIKESGSKSKVHCIDLFPDLDDWFQNKDGSWSSSTEIDGVVYKTHENPSVSDAIFKSVVMPVYKEHPVLLDYFEDNIKRAGFGESIVPHRGNSSGFVGRSKIKCRLAFIDGGHSFGDVSADIIAMEEILQPGGWLLFDDYDFDGVKRAVDVLVKGSSRYDSCVRLTGRMIAARRAL